MEREQEDRWAHNQPHLWDSEVEYIILDVELHLFALPARPGDRFGTMLMIRGSRFEVRRLFAFGLVNF